MNQLTKVLEKKLSELLTFIDSNITLSDNLRENYKSLKSNLSSKEIADKLNINKSLLAEFEVALNNFYKHKDTEDLNYISALRFASWLETISSATNNDFSIDIDELKSNEQLAIKQVRAIELLLREVILTHNGGKESLVGKLNEFLKQEVVQKWIASGDDTGVLSGTTFSELSALFLDKRLFASYDELFPSEKGLKYDKKKQKSLRYFLDDIRIIRNSIAHNKKVSNVKLELLNAYYEDISSKIEKSNKEGKTTVNPGVYLDVSEEELKTYIGSVKEDLIEVKEGVEDISRKVDEVLEDTSEIKQVTREIQEDTASNKSMMKYIMGAVIVLLLLVGGIFFIQKNDSDKTDEIANNTASIKDDIKDVKEIVTGDAELKNMSNTGDLSVVKELNERTKPENAKRIAIIYFDNTSEEVKLDKLKKGLAGMLISDLSNVNMLDIVERDRLEDILKEQNLNNSKKFDASTASKIGELLGAEIILTGAYFEMFGSFRIDARFIDVETGEILKSEGVDGAAANFFKLEKQLAWKIINNMDVSLSEEEKSNLEKVEKEQSISYDASLMFSEALEEIDAQHYDNAEILLKKVLEFNSNFRAAKDELEKLKANS